MQTLRLLTFDKGVTEFEELDIVLSELPCSY